MFKTLLSSISNVMGLKESKAVSLSFEDARSRISEAEYRRLHEAFKRVATQNSHMSKSAFFKEVLGDLFPIDIAEYLYVTCGGTSKGITFKDLVSALVVLTKGTFEEKVKFIFSFYANDGNAIHREDFLRILSDVECVSPRENINRLFNSGGSVELDHFYNWISTNRNATSISSWLLNPSPSSPGFGSNGFQLSDDHETPTFYQTLSGVTHLEEEDIIELEKRYWQLQSCSKSGKMDLGTWGPLVAPPIPESIISGLFDAFDENRDGHIDFKEMACGISAAARGPLIERQKFCFKIFDGDKDGLLCGSELASMISVMKAVLREHLPDNPKEDVVAVLTKEDGQLVDEMFKSAVGSSVEKGITLEEYLVWSLGNPLPEVFLALIYQVCQIVLGLKPLDPSEEYETVSGWLAREERRGLVEAQTWFLVSMDWWNSWLNYTSPNPPAMSNSDSGVGSIGGSAGASIEMSGESRASSGRTNSRNCWSFKKSTAPSDLEPGQNIVVTSSFRQTGGDFEMSDAQVGLGQPSASSLSLATLDSSHYSTCSSTPSPINSPGTTRRVNGAHRPRRRRPGAIDNSHLLAPVPAAHARIPSLTGEGGRLRQHLMEGRDFKILPKSLWLALQAWYGVGVALPRTVIATEKSLELELYPFFILLYRHAVSNPVKGNMGAAAVAASSSSPWAGMAGAYGAAALSTMSYVQNHNLLPPKRVLTFTAAFSRSARVATVCETIFSALAASPDNTRLDLLTPDDLSFCLVLEDDKQTLEEAGIADRANILIETRNKDQTWPEEIGVLAAISDFRGSKRVSSVSSSSSAVEKGLTGLNNLGNTCFMNSALQCVSHTTPLTLYFLAKMHAYEFNRGNPLGMKGHLAKRYGDLIQDLWAGNAKSIAPLKLRWTIGKAAARFSGTNQNDAQELLAFLLDGLHEDLNRVTEKPYVGLKDSNSRPDVICAQEAWENHLLRDKSIVVDLFHGQLKSSVSCHGCGTESTRFDPFNYLTLPLPMESYILCDIVVIRENGSVPIRYGILAGSEDRVSQLKTKLSELISNSDCSEPVAAGNLVLSEIRSSRFLHIFHDNQRLKGAWSSRPIYAYEVSLPSQNNNFSEDQQIKRILTSAKNGNASKKVEGVSVSVPGHSRESSVSSTSSANTTATSGVVEEHSIVVVHRKILRQETYFLASQKSSPILFGLPLIVPFSEGMTQLELYKRVWALVARLVSPLPPPSEGPNISNHAYDCDDSLGYEYPFALRIVARNVETICGVCEWHKFCRGCSLACLENEKLDKLNLNPAKVCLAIDWDPTALHLRYQMTAEFDHVEDPSLSDGVRKLGESVALYSCLESFTKEEELSEEEKYSCTKCGTLQLATKKLQIWRLPPILIVHFKRFQHVQGRWVKSHKGVEFPFINLNLTKYLADVPKRTAEIGTKPKGTKEEEAEESDKELFPLQDFHQHRLVEGINPFKLDYRLYAIVCHNGIMGGGHYLAYAKNGNGKWYCFNDSSCREVTEEQIETSSAYMLFYERNGLDPEAYLPRIDPKASPIVTDDELEAEENDMKKICTAF